MEPLRASIYAAQRFRESIEMKRSIYFSYTVEFIEEYSFDTSEPKKYPTIHAIADSCLIEYAKQNELPYEITNDT